MPINHEDSFDFGFVRGKSFDDNEPGWRDIPMFGVPDVNGDGKNNYADLSTLIWTNLVLSFRNPASVHGEYDKDSNSVTVTYTDRSGNTTAVATYDYDDKAFTYFNDGLFS
jgi:hypothetical protein